MKRRIMKAVREKVITFSLIVAMMMGMMPVNAFAAETGSFLEPTVFGSNSSAITSYADVETWYEGVNTMRVFTFTDKNTTSPKIVEGNYVQIRGTFRIV